MHHSLILRISLSLPENSKNSKVDEGKKVINQMVDTNNIQHIGNNTEREKEKEKTEKTSKQSTSSVQFFFYKYIQTL